MHDPGFHDAFTAALDGDAARLRPWLGDGQAAGLTVYRNTIAKGCADALVAQFPAVRKIMGERWLGAAAVAYARVHPPATASLLAYGRDFPAWLAAFPPAAERPYLADLARLDFLWTEAQLADDRAPLRPDALQALAPDDLFHLGLALHPATRFAWFATTAPSLWLALQPDEPPAAFELAPEPEGLLIVRPGLDIDARRIGAGAYALLAACRDGACLAAAGAAALGAEPGLPLDSVFAELLELGAFQDLIATEPT